MIKVRTLEESARRWAKGMQHTPYMPCKHCGKMTRGWWRKGRCQYCGGELPYSEGVAVAREQGLIGY